jgi:thymidine kinase
VPTIPTGGHAGLEVIVGSMFSGESEELIRRVKRAIIARRAFQVFKPAVDDRFGAELVRSHDGDSFVIGAQEAYEPRCRGCHEVPRRTAVEA